ncbi:hypothetical protein PSHT_10335 [Puccinia striiformis]|uniref:Uncharacterized protein n=1 Tax=Puccinia striiformis TaxID=27350 RepID=A0A2S4VAC5_9BASI|nr:hypothetical protein PSHT_10335 [Puccinia striiformis]
MVTSHPQRVPAIPGGYPLKPAVTCQRVRVSEIMGKSGKYPDTRWLKPHAYAYWLLQARSGLYSC